LARAYFEPELHSGKATMVSFRKVLNHDLGYSEPFIDLETSRFDGSESGDGIAGYYGYRLLLDIRANAEKLWGEKFSARCFHDEFLNYGLLPLRQIQERMSQQKAPSCAH
jgi:uncharacterized protein (DUF885 family)